jgi:hypothetical protein
LLSKATAPALSAFSRMLASGNAVMKMIGVEYPPAIKRLCNSIPEMPGICTSAIRQELSRAFDELRNSPAEANVAAEYPSDLTNLLVAARTEGSSSTIEMTGSWGKQLAFVSEKK